MVGYTSTQFVVVYPFCNIPKSSCSFYRCFDLNLVKSWSLSVSDLEPYKMFLKIQIMVFQQEKKLSYTVFTACFLCWFLSK